MATFADNLALQELFADSFSGVNRLGQGQVAIAQNDLRRRQQLEDAASEISARRDLVKMQNEAVLNRDEMEEKRKLFTLAEQYGVEGVTSKTPTAEVWKKIQTRAGDRIKPVLQDMKETGEKINQLSSVPEKDRDQYFAALILEDPMIAAVMAKYPAIAADLASGKITVTDAQKALSQTRDVKEVQTAFANALPRAHRTLIDYLAVREESSRNSPQVRALLERQKGNVNLYENFSKVIMNPDVLSAISGPQNVTTQAALPAAAGPPGLPAPPRVRQPASASAAGQQEQDQFIRLPSPLGIGEAIGERLPSLSAPGDVISDYLGSVPIALGIDRFAPNAGTMAARQTRDQGIAARDEASMVDALRALSYLEAPYGRFSPSQAAQPITREQIAEALQIRNATRPRAIDPGPDLIRDRAPMMTAPAGRPATPNPIGQKWNEVFDAAMQEIGDPFEAAAFANEAVYAR